MSTKPFSRRDFIKLSSMGISTFVLSSMINSTSTQASTNNRTAMHHEAKAQSVIFLYMSGGISQVDSFDPKPLLRKMNGKPMPVKLDRTQFDEVGNIMGSFWEHKKYGESGIEMTNLFPQIAEQADEMAIIRSMTAKFTEHAQGNFCMHTGFPFLGYPSAGAWVNYGCGTENKNLPGYIVLQSKGASTPHGGVSLFGNAFLPAIHQGSIFNISNNHAVPDIHPYMIKEVQRKALNIIKRLDKNFAERTAAHDAVMASVANAETAYLMQESVPELTDISNESKATLEMYGVNDKFEQKSNYARQCLMARRLVERGVRFVELSCCSVGIGAGGGGNPWDQHGDIERGHGAMAKQVDQPISALMNDLKQRGLLDTTLLVFTGEFGRNPFAQGIGRDHNQQGFSVWLAGGGIKGGTVYGSTDEFGYRAQENIATMYELWATVLHQLGINHDLLTYRYSGRDMRLTDVHGKVWHDVLV